MFSRKGNYIGTVLVAALATQAEAGHAGAYATCLFSKKYPLTGRVYLSQNDVDENPTALHISGIF